MDRSKISQLTLSRTVISTALSAALAMVPSLAMAATARPAFARLSPPAGVVLAQDEDSVPDEDTVPSGQVDKYIAVYIAMQKNHGLSVEQAASKQGLSVDEFRNLEDKIERNPVVHERVLDALKASATGKPVTPSASSQEDKDQ